MLFFDYFEIKKRGIEQENHLFNPSNYIIDYQLFTHHSSTAACAAANQDLFRLIISYLRKSKVNISYAVLARSANSAS